MHKSLDDELAVTHALSHDGFEQNCEFCINEWNKLLKKFDNSPIGKASGFFKTADGLRPGFFSIFGIPFLPENKKQLERALEDWI